MNYKKLYIKLIRRAQIRTKLNCYCEKHHVFPKSIFGQNKILVILTGKEHYIAHHLLWKYYLKKYGSKDHKTIKMLQAFWYMNINPQTKEFVKISPKKYEHYRTEFAKQQSILFQGKNHPLYGKSPSEETKLKISLANKGKLGPMLNKKHSMKTKTKMTLAKFGKNHPNFGKKLPKCSERMKIDNPMFNEEIKRRAQVGNISNRKPVVREDINTRRNKNIREYAKSKRRWF